MTDGRPAGVIPPGLTPGDDGAVITPGDTVVATPSASAAPPWAADALARAVELAPEVSPRADFYRYVNQRWLDGLVLPPYKAEASMLSLLADKVQADVSALVDRAVGLPRGQQTQSERRISALHASFMNEDVIERLGPAVYRPALTAIAGAADQAELSRVLGRLQAQGIGGAFDFSVSAGAGGGAYELLLAQGGLGLGAEVMTAPSVHAELLAKYRAHLVTMLGHAGVDEAAGVADCVLRLETELAAGHVRPGADGRLRSRSLRGPASGVAARDAGFAWRAWLDGLGVTAGDAVIRFQQAEFLDAFEAWWAGHALAELKAWLSWRFVHEMVPFGPRAVFSDNFRFYGQTVSGLTSARPRRLRVLSFVETFSGEAIAERYVADNLTVASIGAARALVGELVASYRGRLAGAGWLTAATRTAALRKLDAMVFEIGAPSRPPEASRSLADPADLAGNVLRGRAAEIGGQLGRIGTVPDRSQWLTHAHQATAYYRHGLNQVVVPAAMLQSPIFDPAADAAGNFAILGSIIAHEMAHAFYGLGGRYDERGRPADWWDPADAAEFSRRSGPLIEQYGGYAPAQTPGQRVNGARTLSENVADIVGLTVAADAYARRLAGGPDAPGAMRRFFIGWASWWRSQCTTQRLSGRLSWDRHAPSEFRCNGALGHVPAFYAAFDVAPGDLMYLPADRRFDFL